MCRYCMDGCSVFELYDIVFFFKQKTAYEMRISDWSSDVCSSDLRIVRETPRGVSMVLGPAGEVLGDTLSEDEGLLYQDIDLADCVEPKQFHDEIGRASCRDRVCQYV